MKQVNRGGEAENEEKEESGVYRDGTVYSRLIEVVLRVAEGETTRQKRGKIWREWKERPASARHRVTTAEGCSTHARMSELRSYPHSSPPPPDPVEI